MKRFILPFFWCVISLMNFSASFETQGGVSDFFVLLGVICLLCAVGQVVFIFLD